MINIDTKIKTWNNLPQEFRDEIRELYRKACYNERVHQNSEPQDKVCLGIAMGKKQLLEQLFGFSVINLTLDKEIIIK